MALVTASGPLGLSAFFPPPETTLRLPVDDAKLQQTHYLPPPHLPLVPSWSEGNFSLEAVIGATRLPGQTVDLRAWTMQLLARYVYTTGTTKFHFHMATSPSHVSKAFGMVDSDPSVALLGLNDDIVIAYERTKEIMGDWFQGRWPNPAVWEKEWTRRPEDTDTVL